VATSNHSDELKWHIVHQITVRGYAVREVSGRLGVSTHSLCKWIKLFDNPEPKKPGVNQECENRWLKRELDFETRQQNLIEAGV